MHQTLQSLSIMNPCGTAGREAGVFIEMPWLLLTGSPTVRRQPIGYLKSLIGLSEGDFLNSFPGSFLSFYPENEAKMFATVSIFIGRKMRHWKIIEREH